MELLTEDSALEGEICAAADYKDGVDNKISELEEAWIVGHPPVPVVSPSTSTSNSTAATSQPTINLPKVDLPKFMAMCCSTPHFGSNLRRLWTKSIILKLFVQLIER